jgi:hypothetical protein
MQVNARFIDKRVAIASKMRERVTSSAAGSCHAASVDVLIEFSIEFAAIISNTWATIRIQYIIGSMLVTMHRDLSKKHGNRVIEHTASVNPSIGEFAGIIAASFQRLFHRMCDIAHHWQHACGKDYESMQNARKTQDCAHRLSFSFARQLEVHRRVKLKGWWICAGRRQLPAPREQRGFTHPAPLSTSTKTSLPLMV